MNTNNEIPAPGNAELNLKPSRRDFARLLGCAVLAGAGIAAARPLAFLRSGKVAEPKAVAKADEIPVGGYKLLRYPTENDPCVLVRLGDDRYVAYSQSCTHLMCPVYYQSERQQFVCPCHEGYFSALDGSVLAGPPRRPLPRYVVEIRDGEVLVGPQYLERA